MEVDAILEALNRVAPEHGFESVSVTLPPLRDIADRAEIESAIAPWLEGKGWIARQSGVRALPHQDDNPTLGQIVSAELSLGDKTLQIRRMPGHWVLTEIVESAGATHLADTVKHVTLANGLAVYRRYWSLPDDGTTEIRAWRFVTFEEIGK